MSSNTPSCVWRLSLVGFLVPGPTPVCSSKACLANGLCGVAERQRSRGLWCQTWFPSGLGMALRCEFHLDLRTETASLFYLDFTLISLITGNLYSGKGADQDWLAIIILKYNHVDTLECELVLRFRQCSLNENGLIFPYYSVSYNTSIFYCILFFTFWN